MKPARAPGRGLLRTSSRQESLSAFFFLLPDVAGLILFAFVPIILAVYISLTQWNGYTQQLFVGLKNYTDLFQDAEFGKSLLTTLEYAAVFVATMTVLSLCCALIINSVKGMGQEIYRTMIFTPYAISAVIAAMVWTFLYQVPKGYFNSLLMSIGLDKMLFLGSPEQALFSVIAVSLWATLGYNMIIFMAAIKDVPAELYEAAEIDGANFFERFKTITLPMLKNTSLFIIVMSTIAALQVFDQIKIMTDGGPAKATNVTVYYIYKMGFTVGQLGYASATAVLLFIAISIFTLFQFRLLNGGKTKDEA